MFLFAAFILALSPLPDSLLVEVKLVDAQTSVLVQAVLSDDSTLHLPTPPMSELLGVSFSAPWIAVTELQAAYPATRIVWEPRTLRVLVFDPQRSLPATRAVYAEIVARTQAAFLLPVQSGPFVALAVDDSLHTLLDVGYSFRGRAAFAGRVDETGAGSWALIAAPSSHVFLSYQDGVYQPPYVSGRVSAGPFWLSASATPHSPVEMSGLIRFRGDVQAFASRQYAVVTINRSHQLAVSVAYDWVRHRTAARVSAGPAYASPFQFPVTTNHFSKE